MVLAAMSARRRPATKMPSLFDSPTPIFLGGSLELSVCMLPFKTELNVLLWLEVWLSGSNVWSSGGAGEGV
jgi:hypothetical protein